MKLPQKEVFKHGSYVHSIIEDYHRGEDDFDNESKRFVDKYSKIYGRESDFIEEFIEMPLVDPFTKKPLFNGILLSGRIDRIHNGIVYDHKTSSTSWSQNKLDKDMQATFYSYMYRMKFGKPEEGVIFNIIRKTKSKNIGEYGITPMKTTRKAHDLANMILYIKEYLHKIKVTDGKHHTNWCENRYLFP